MNEDIIRMAKQAGMEQDGDNFFSPNHEEMDVHIDDLKRLVEIARAEEREACAKLVDYWEARQGEHSDAIRARGRA